MNVKTAIRDQPSDYLANLPVGGADVFGRTTDTWQHAIDEWTRWLEAGQKSRATVYQRRWQLRRLAEAYPRRSPWKLDLDDLIRWLAGHGWAPETTKSASSALKSFYKWGQLTDRTKRNPAEKLPAVKVGKHLPRPAGADLVTAVVATVDARTRLMVMLAYWAGLRASEIAGLRWDQVDGDALRVTGKGGTARVVPLHDVLTAELDRWRDGGAAAYRYHTAAHVWIFPGQTPGGLHPHTVSAALSRALGPGVVGHQLRHSFATRVLEATDNLGATQQLLGHASPATTRIYARTSTRALRAAIDALGDTP